MAKKLRKAAAAGGRAAGAGAGGFLTGIFSSPAGLGAIGIFTLLAVVFIFRDKIGEALGNFGKGFEIPPINIELPPFNFPEIKFPDFNIDFGAGFGDIGEQISKGFEEFTKIFERGAVTPPEQDPALSGEGFGLAGALAERRRALDQALAEKELAAADIPLRDIQDDIEGLTPAQSFAFIERGVIPSGFEVVGGVLQQIMQAITPPIPSTLTPSPVQSFLIDEPTQKFIGEGVSFEGGAIFETPIENLSLSQIIDKFMVTASQAANIRAIASGFTPEEEQFLAGSGDIGGFSTGFNPPAVSDSQFQGLTPEEIALRLTGGNIQNF